jgi:hypothetical protein
MKSFRKENKIQENIRLLQEEKVEGLEVKIKENDVLLEKMKKTIEDNEELLEKHQSIVEKDACRISELEADGRKKDETITSLCSQASKLEKIVEGISE